MVRKEKTGIFQKICSMIKQLFSRKKRSKDLNLTDKEIHLEPKYWPEVREFIDKLNHLVDSHTIEDSNIQHVNRRIIAYIQEQINIKGQITDVDARFDALHTLADRILSHNLNKIVGLKESTSSTAEFSDAVENFKQRLEVKRQEERQHMH